MTNEMPRAYLQEDGNEPIHPRLSTPKGKVIEVRPDGIYSLWVVHPHGTNIPAYLKDCKFTSSDDALKEVQKWIDTIKVKED